MKKVIVTGADGFIGRNLVNELVSENYDIYAIVMDRDSAVEVLGINEHIHYIECNMSSYEELVRHDELRGIPLLFHFAWAGVSDEKSSDYVSQLNNVKCACDLQSVAVGLGIKRMVFADSIMEYEHQKAFEEGFFDVPLRNTYHVTKNTARHLLQLRCANMGMEFVSVLISNVYGVGEMSPRLINTAIRKLIQGEHMSFTPSEQLYDFIYISDAVRGIRIAAENGKNNKEYYIGSEEPRKLKEYLFEMRDIIAPGFELGIGELDFRGVSLTYNEFDTKALYRDLSFECEYSFREGIEATVKWMKTKLI